ncbi:MAG: phosphate ABC transporter ATP-binding protein [Candidatus Edwardsbacteria bacterium]|nr:phosphate ABC transporter ATP-binding protein [Candidatus Edwardsbacteria bacterium]
MNPKIDIQGLTVFFGREAYLRGLHLQVPEHRILGVIGPSSSGKTTFLRALNRMNDLESGSRAEGAVLLDGQDIYRPDCDVVALRKKIGMVFALPVALPMSIYDNVVYGPRLAGNHPGHLDEIVEQSLKAAFLWDEVKYRLKASGLRLSGGQQQRLCLARTLALEPEVILLDEPCSGLDPISTAKIEEALTILKERYTIILVTNNTKQAARVSDNTAFFLLGEMIEMGPTEKVFTVPADKRTNDYITGRFG